MEVLGGPGIGRTQVFERDRETMAQVQEAASSRAESEFPAQATLGSRQSWAGTLKGADMDFSKIIS